MPSLHVRGSACEGFSHSSLRGAFPFIAAKILHIDLCEGFAHEYTNPICCCGKSARHEMKSSGLLHPQSEVSPWGFQKASPTPHVASCINRVRMLRVNVVLDSQYTRYVSSERAAETRLLRAEGVRRTYNHRCAQSRAARSQAMNHSPSIMIAMNSSKLISPSPSKSNSSIIAALHFSSARQRECISGSQFLFAKILAQLLCHSFEVLQADLLCVVIVEKIKRPPEIDLWIPIQYALRHSEVSSASLSPRFDPLIRKNES